MRHPASGGTKARSVSRSETYNKRKADHRTDGSSRWRNRSPRKSRSETGTDSAARSALPARLVLHPTSAKPRKLYGKPALVSSLSRLAGLLGGGGSPERTGLVPSMGLVPSHRPHASRRKSPEEWAARQPTLGTHLDPCTGIDPLTHSIAVAGVRPLRPRSRGVILHDRERRIAILRGGDWNRITCQPCVSSTSKNLPTRCIRW